MQAWSRVSCLNDMGQVCSVVDEYTQWRPAPEVVINVAHDSRS